MVAVLSMCPGEAIVKTIRKCNIAFSTFFLNFLIYNLYFSVREEITDVETFSMLDNNDFTRLQLTTKMVKIIQKYQKLLEDDLEPEEQTQNVTTQDTNAATRSPSTSTSCSFNLEKVYICNTNHIS